MLRYGFLFCVLMLFATGCNEFQQAVKDAKKDIPPPQKDNFIVLLDLSDRILFDNQQQVGKDLTVLKAIYGIFKSRINEKDPTHLYYNVKDKLKVLIAAQKTTPRNLYDMAGNLRVELDAEQPEKKANAIDITEKNFNTVLPEIYKQAVISNNSSDYAGADIWKYFDEDLTDDLEKDGQNTLFIITDGYMNVENNGQRPAQNNRFTSCSQIINNLKKQPDWEKKFDESDYGLLPVQKKFSNLKVVLVEMNPKEDWSGEYNLLIKIWSKWFNEMGINTYRFIKNDNINEVKESMEKFMQLKIAGRIEPVQWTPVTETAEQKNIHLTNASTEATKAISFSSVTTNPEKKSLPEPSKLVTNPAEIPAPTETAADLLPKKKSDSSQVKKSSRKSDNDILNDATPRKGFNTGIKKNNPKQ